MPRVHKV